MKPIDAVILAAAVVVLVTAIIINLFVVDLQWDSNHDKYGKRVSDREIQCWKVCGDKYYYEQGTLTKPTVCTCRKEEGKNE